MYGRSVGHLRKRPQQGHHLQEHRPIRSKTHDTLTLYVINDNRCQVRSKRNDKYKIEIIIIIIIMRRRLIIIVVVIIIMIIRIIKKE